MENPFKSYEIDGKQFCAVTADDRIAMVKRFNSVIQCEAALRVEGLQKTVQKAVERRQTILRAEMEIIGQRANQRERDLIFLADMLAKLDRGETGYVREMICDWLDELGGGDAH